MDFHGLPRKSLQTLCKKNHIPANMTNLAMADALQSLQTVEGRDELLATGFPFFSPVTPKAQRSSIKRTAAEEGKEQAKPPEIPATATRTRRKSLRIEARSTGRKTPLEMPTLAACGRRLRTSVGRAVDGTPVLHEKRFVLTYCRRKQSPEGGEEEAETLQLGDAEHLIGGACSVVGSTLGGREMKRDADVEMLNADFPLQPSVGGMVAPEENSSTVMEDGDQGSLENVSSGFHKSLVTDVLKEETVDGDSASNDRSTDIMTSESEEPPSKETGQMSGVVDLSGKNLDNSGNDSCENPVREPPDLVTECGADPLIAPRMLKESESILCTTSSPSRQITMPVSSLPKSETGDYSLLDRTKQNLDHCSLSDMIDNDDLSYESPLQETDVICGSMMIGNQMLHKESDTTFPPACSQVSADLIDTTGNDERSYKSHLEETDTTCASAMIENHMLLKESDTHESQADTLLQGLTVNRRPKLTSDEINLSSHNIESQKGSQVPQLALILQSSKLTESTARTLIEVDDRTQNHPPSLDSDTISDPHKNRGEIWNERRGEKKRASVAIYGDDGFDSAGMDSSKMVKDAKKEGEHSPLASLSLRKMRLLYKEKMEARKLAAKGGRGGAKVQEEEREKMLTCLSLGEPKLLYKEKMEAENLAPRNGGDREAKVQSEEEKRQSLSVISLRKLKSMYKKKAATIHA